MSLPTRKCAGCGQSKRGYFSNCGPCAAAIRKGRELKKKREKAEIKRWRRKFNRAMRGF